MRPTRGSMLLAALLVATAALFAIGVAVERGRESGETKRVASGSSEGTHVEGGSEGTGSAESAPPTEASSGAKISSGERVLGVNVDSPWLVGAAVVVSVALAAAVWLRDDRRLFAVVVAFGFAFAAFDLAHAAVVATGSVTAISIVVAIGHAGVGVIAARRLQAVAT